MIFANVKGITIPEGVVKRITQGSAVLWQAAYDAIVSGVSPLTLPSAVQEAIVYLKQLGVCEQNGTPTPSAPVDIKCNNGTIKYGQYGKNLNVGELDNVGYTSTGGISTSTTFCGTLWKFAVTEGDKYTVSFGNFPDGVSGFFVNTWLTDGTWNARQAISAGSGNSLTYTIGENVGFINFTLYKTGGITIGENSWMQVEAGAEPTAYEPAHFGLHIEGTPEVLSVGGKNWFGLNASPAETTYLDSTGGTGTSANWTLSDFIAVNPATQYTFNPNSTAGASAKIGYYTAEKTFISAIDSGPQTFTTPNNCFFMRFSYRNESTNIQLEVGSTATSYEPYIGRDTATAEMLLGVGDYKDEQDIISGAITREVGIKVLDGKENVGTSNATFTIAIAGRVTSKTPLVCSHFEYSTKVSSQVEDLKIVSFSSTNIGFRYDACADTTAFKTWLANQYEAGTPVIVIYPLATAATESVTAQPLNTAEGDNVISITAEVSNIPLEVKYKRN